MFRTLFGNDEKYTGLFVDWIEEWSQLIRRDNWYTFHPFMLELEDDRMMGGVEFVFIILGFGVRVRYNYTSTETVEKIQRQVEDIKSGLVKTKPFSDLLKNKDK